MRAPARVSAVVVAYRGEDCIDACLRALLATRYPALDVLVVDNGGGDLAAAVAAGYGDRVSVLTLDRNHGFAGGANRGIAAVAGSADIVALVNQDCVVDPDWLAPMATQLLSDPTIGVVGARLLDSDGVTLQHAGGVVAANGLTSHLGRGDVAAGAFAETSDVEYVCGALIALRVDTWRRLGPFDEGYFPAYFEEVDFCVRLRAAAMRVVYVPASRARHAEAASSAGSASRLFLRRYHRSRLRFVAHHLIGGGRGASWLRAEAAWLLRLRRWHDIAPVLGAYACLPRLLLHRRREVTAP
ncbi:MAG: glycosyltransferase family 2 protein [Deltaproteobacteria bacterium]|nr:glycosyltransferase family 2 protein [Deltaproteobacteria bacterium]